jgi:hypothetical protein
LNEFELVHPLNSGEIGKDLSLSSGQIVGFSLWVHVDDCGNVCCAIPEGCAIGTMDPYYNPSVYANYVVASPAVLTPTVDMTVATTSNPITVTPHTASVGRTVMEPVPESSSSSRSIIWGVLVGLLFSSPIAIYRHMSQRRGDMRIGKKVLGVSRRRWQESLVVGQLVASFMIVGVIYLGTPDLVPEVRAFVSDFHLVEVLQNVWWYVPATINPVVLAATQEFCYAFGLVLIAVLGLKFAKRLSRRTETFLSMMFWLGAGYIVGLLSSGVLSWFSFLASLVIWTGVSIVGRALILVRRPAVK